MKQAKFDIAKARKETPACEKLIHFNNAGASLMPQPVARSLHAYLDQEEHIGGYETVGREHEALEHFYQATAKLLNCSGKEIAFIENATRAWDMAFYSFNFNAGDRILTSVAEYGSNVIAYIQQAKKYGVEIVFVPDDEYGQLDTQALLNLIDDRVKLISISHIPTGGGLLNPAAQVGQIAKAAGIPYLLDSCQGVGQLPLDVEVLGCDMLCGTGRKYLRGPRATGFLYVRQEWIEKLEPPILDQHAATLISPTEYQICEDARRFENWEQFFAGKVALGIAIDYALEWGLEAIQDRVFKLADRLRKELASIDGVQVTDVGQQRCGIVTFYTEQLSAQAIQRAMTLVRINVSVSSGSGSLVSFQQRDLTEVVRASVHYFNTDEEVDYFVQALSVQLSK